MKLLIMKFPPDPVISTLLGPSIPLSTLFSIVLAPCCSLSVRNQISHPYKKQQSKFKFSIFESLYSWIASEKKKES
jgi:hypothetical protein